jgi:hypothetical protein
MIIAPLRSFLIDYKINNPSDLATHYVQSVVRNINGAVLATVQLTDNGSGYFSKEWMTPADPTGTGTQISILTTVYDDAGYTSESLVYGTTLSSFIIRDLAGIRSTFGGTGSSMAGLSNIDYKRIEKMIKDAVEGIEMPVIPAFPKAKEVDLVSLENKLKSHIDEQDKSEELAELKAIISGVVQAIKSELDKKVIATKEELAEVKTLPDKFQMAETSDDELHDLVTTHSTQHLSEVSELKTFVQEKFNELEKKITATLSEPVTLQLHPSSNGKREAKQEEPINPRTEMFRKLLNA